jgi:hypothetical protein
MADLTGSLVPGLSVVAAPLASHDQFEEGETAVMAQSGCSR